MDKVYAEQGCKNKKLERRAEACRETGRELWGVRREAASAD